MSFEFIGTMVIIGKIAIIIKDSEYLRCAG